jgi:hypothetical protein
MNQINAEINRLASTVKKLDEKGRQTFLLKLVKDKELLADVSDILDIIKAKEEPSRKYNEFVKELKAGNRL